MVDERGYESLEPGGDDTNAFDDDDFSVPPEPPTLNASDVAQIVRTLGLEYDDMRHGWWLPGEPSPVFCTSIPHAVAESQRLCDNDVAALRAELADASADAERSDALHRRRYENIATALGRRYPTAEEIVAAAITFIDTARAASGEDASRG